MKKAKKLLAILLSVTMLLSLTTGMNLTALANTNYGVSLLCDDDDDYYEDDWDDEENCDDDDWDDEENCDDDDWCDDDDDYDDENCDDDDWCDDDDDYDDEDWDDDCEDWDDDVNDVDEKYYGPYLTYGNYQYAIMDNGNAVITKYTGNSSVTNLSIPSSINKYTITAINSYAFDGSEFLNTVTIPSTISKIGIGIFFDCKSLKTINVDANNKYFVSVSGALYNYNKTLLIKYPENNSATSYIIPSTVKAIGNCAFEQCNKLTQIAIPNSVTEIEHRAFDNCKSLKNIYYCGTQSEWEKIEIDCEIPSNVKINYDCISSHPTSNHISDAGTVTKKATCTATGTKTYKCTKCKAVLKTETIAKKVHTYKAATCTTPKKCTVCGATSGKALGHSWNSGTVTKKATCTATGTKTYKCTRCSKTKTETIAKKAHTVVIDKAITATCTRSGLTEGKHCSVCKTVIVAQKFVEKTPHKAGPGVITKNATCSATGTKTYTCKTCGKKYIETLPKLAHKSDNGKITKKATTSANGTKTYKCTVCKAIIKTQTIKKISSATLSASSYTYDGKVKKPTVTVKNSDGTKIPATCYTVTYSNNKNVGKATVKIVMKGNYSGSFVRTFNINPKGTSISKLTATKGGFKATWKKQATQTTGYILQYSTSSSFSNYKYFTLGSNKTLSKSVTGLSKGKKYYVRVRTYKVVNGTKYYSGWSSAKAVTTKK